MFRLLLLFIGLPAVELALLIEIGRHIGTAPTLGLIAITGALGAALARGQGLRVLGEIRRELEAGRLPAGSLVDGVLILLAAAVLITPGILTDVFGFFCLVPGVRFLIKRELLRRFERAVAERRVHLEVYSNEAGPPVHERPMKDVTPERRDDPWGDR
jgi:UPF0716 protein FxsA